MAYTRSRVAGSRKRTYRKKASYKKKAPRSYAKKRSYRKRGGMSKRRILDITSIKKRDVMMPYTNSTASSQSGNVGYNNIPAIVTGGLGTNTCAAFLWCATARDASINTSGAVGSKIYEATRTSSSPYMVGLSEKIEIQVSSGMPWQWRRICFTCKGPFLVPNNGAAGTTFNNYTETSAGYVRVLNQVLGSPGADPMFSLFSKIFKGAYNTDWVDPMIAPTDNTRVTIKYDKIVSLASGNEDGFIRAYKRYHPMNATLYYDDDQSGGAESTAFQSVQGKKGMGDYFVVDLFRARIGSATTDQLSFAPTSSLYWHEK